jgi:hypothetical protein
MDSKLLREALGSGTTMRDEVANTTWYSTAGPIKLKDMEDDHLVNTAIYTCRKSDDIQLYNFPVEPQYHGRTWYSWSILFKAELEYREQERTETADSKGEDEVTDSYDLDYYR